MRPAGHVSDMPGIKGLTIRLFMGEDMCYQIIK